MHDYRANGRSGPKKIARMDQPQRRTALAPDEEKGMTTGGFIRADHKQVGGNHYKDKAIQPWEVIERNHMGFFDGNALKYLMRFRDKGGVEDLQKAIHYIEKLIEMQNAVQVGARIDTWTPFDGADDGK